MKDVSQVFKTNTLNAHYYFLLACWYSIILCIVQQQISYVRPKIFSLCFLKFSAKSNDFSLFFPKATRKSPNLPKTKAVQKNANRHRPEAKG